jgi:hypothetical protein
MKDDDLTLGYLFNFTGHGVYSPDGPQPDFPPEQVDAHNALLSAAEIKGLDENCQIGEWGAFYYVHKRIETFIGELVAPEADTHITWNKQVTFTRKGKTFWGELDSQGGDLFEFERIA